MAIGPSVGPGKRGPIYGYLRPDLTSSFRPLPASASETAIMSMSFSSSTTATSPSTKCSMQLGQNDIPWLMTSSMSSSGYGGGGTGSELRTTVWRPRKKLKARRMPRSMSDGEHLSFTNGRYRFPSSGADNVPREDADDDAILGKDESSDPYPRHLDIETPTAPRATPTSDSTEGEDDGGRVFDVDDLLTNVRGGGGEAMAVVDEVGDDGERTAGDGGSTVSGADQSDVYEWDEYKVRKRVFLARITRALRSWNRTFGAASMTSKGTSANLGIFILSIASYFFFFVNSNRLSSSLLGRHLRFRLLIGS